MRTYMQVENVRKNSQFDPNRWRRYCLALLYLCMLRAREFAPRGAQPNSGYGHTGALLFYVYHATTSMDTML